jgi:zinc/manganese transport system substrate-binding protein
MPDCTVSTPFNVVAAENVWGSIAAQLGGPGVTVTNIIDDPNIDPHDYEPTAADARAIAQAQEVIVNGAGYDPWADKLLAADPNADRTELDIGARVSAQMGDNPHRWYYPADVQTVINQITEDYEQIDPADQPCFLARNRAYATGALARYNALLAQIREKHAGAKVAASESIVVGIAQATGLALVTPPDLLDSVSEGTDPTEDDLGTANQQLDDHVAQVFILNPQNTTPDVQGLVDHARAQHIPVTTMTETLTPKGATFQDWQVAQLQSLLDALDHPNGP